jgi:hypothetical protein
MGTPLVFFGLHEEVLIPRWSEQVPFYKSFIDDVIGAWIPHPDQDENSKQWTEFQADMNGWYGLEWECTTPSTSINFMDLSITLVDGRISTSIFEKAQNLYLYIPPHSSHPKVVYTGLIYGQVLRYRRLCSLQSDADAKIQEFFSRLTARGHKIADLLPLFQRAEESAAKYLARSPEEHITHQQQKWVDSQNQVYLHLQFHPEDPPSHAIQRLWREQVSHPPGELPLPKMQNCAKDAVGFSKLVVAYSRPLNLRNRFSVRDIKGRGKPASEYLAE